MTAPAASHLPLARLAAVAALALALASCASDLRSRQEKAFHPYRIGPRPAVAADLDPAIRPWVGRTVHVSPDGTGIDTLRSCYELRLAYMRNESRSNLDPYRIESIRRDERFSHLMVAVLRGPDGETDKLWFENDASEFLEALTEDFLVEDPFAAHPDWSPATWSAIREQQPGPGMSPDMVLLALGEPLRVEASDGGKSLWIYPWFGAVLTFDAASRLESAEVEDPWL